MFNRQYYRMTQLFMHWKIQWKLNELKQQQQQQKHCTHSIWINCERSM